MNLGEGSAVPAWVAFDGQTLAFEAYFVEPAVDGRDRPRRCVLRYYLEDGTVDVCEPKTDNSGLEQGRLLKRHRAVAANGAPLTHADFVVGGVLSLYGRAYHIVGCDAFTRDFLVREGFVVAPDGIAPRALVDEGPGVLGTIGMGVRGVGGRRVAEAARGGVDEDARGDENADPKMDALDRRVLRFFCAWDDRANGGVVSRYVLNYFLGDGTVEVLEEQSRNAGRDPFPKMLARSRLPAHGAFDVGVPGEGRLGAGSPAHVSHRDLRVGGTVGVYGRTLTIHDCDDFTSAFYVKEEGRTIAEMAPRPFVESAPRPTPTIPPHNGFGSEADSLANCVSLVPKRAPFDVRNFEKNDGKNLVFTAQFEGASEGRAVPPNDERRFIVTFYLVDNTVSVYEPPVVNSGVIGGKFLERTMEPVKKPGSRAPYVQRDFAWAKSSCSTRTNSNSSPPTAPRRRSSPSSRLGETDERRCRRAVDQRVSPVPKNVNRRDVYSTRWKK